MTLDFSRIKPHGLEATQSLQIHHLKIRRKKAHLRKLSLVVMDNTESPIIISIAPNGARKTKQEHPNIPITPDEIAAEAKACQEQGAALLHLHVRNDDQTHVLDVERYIKATKAVRDAVGDGMIIQATSEACGIYNATQQIEVIKELNPEAVSLAVRELVPDAKHEPAAKEFFHWLERQGCCPQFILYNDEDTERFFDLKERGVIPAKFNFVLFVLGRYSAGQKSSPMDLLPYLYVLNKHGDVAKNITWAVCAFGALEGACMQSAALMNGHVRIGFENNMYLADGTLANNNADLVKQFAQASTLSGRKIASAKEARLKLFG